MDEKPFFIGWESKTPHGSYLRKIAVAGLVAAVIIAALGASLQQTIGTGVFEFGNIRDFRGVFLKSPAPMLVLEKSVEGETVFYLVNPLKHGLSDVALENHHLRLVDLKGTLIRNEQDAMIEVTEIKSTDEGIVSNPLEISVIESSVTLTGEIVDSKCHLGVMNPGRFKPHRACAIQCVRGGIPPILVTRTPVGNLVNYLLVGPDGEALNDQILEWIALPVAVTGQLKQIGDRWVLYAAPSTIKPLDNMRRF